MRLKGFIQVTAIVYVFDEDIQDGRTDEIRQSLKVDEISIISEPKDDETCIVINNGSVFVKESYDEIINFIKDAI